MEELLYRTRTLSSSLLAFLTLALKYIPKLLLLLLYSSSQPPLYCTPTTDNRPIDKMTENMRSALAGVGGAFLSF